MINKQNINILVVLELITSVICIISLGFFNFLGLVFASMIVGVILLFFSFKSLGDLRDDSSIYLVLSKSGICFAAVLFLIPGVLSSLLAIVVLVACLLLRMIGPKKSFYEERNNYYNNNDEDIIDVEIIEDRK